MNAFCVRDTGSGPLYNTPYGTLAYRSGRVVKVTNVGGTSARIMQYFEVIYPASHVSIWFRIWASDTSVSTTGTWKPWKRIVTADQFTQSLARNGWTKLPNGLIMQWGRSSYLSQANYKITFPTAFPNVVLSVTTQRVDSVPSTGTIIITSYLKESFTAHDTAGPKGDKNEFYWTALGY